MTAFVKTHNDLLLDCVDSNQPQHHNSLLVLFDLSSAFDTLNHNQLLIVLNQQFGIDNKVLKWLESYLNSWSFLVVVGTQFLQHDLTIVVLQGFVLSPLLFILFTKSWEEVVAAHNMQFHTCANDTQLYLNFQPDNKCENQLNFNKV